MATHVTNLMSEYLGLVRALAWKIHQKLPRAIELDDIYGFGCVGLAEAAQAFDPQRGIKFSTFAYHRIRGAMLDGLSKLAWFKPTDYYSGAYTDENDQLDSPANRGAKHSCKQDYVRQLDDDLEWFKFASKRLTVVSLNQMGSGSPFQVRDNSPSPDEKVANQETTDRVRDLMDELPAAAAELLRAAYFEGLSLKDAGQRQGKSKFWASRLHSKALECLARSLKSEGLE